MGGEVLDEALLGQFAGLWETVDGFVKLKDEVTIGEEERC
jgi:hypothetical protein